MHTSRVGTEPLWRSGVAALAALAALAACKAQRKPTIDGPDLEQRLVQELAAHDFAATVTCPRDRPLARGDVFTCQAAGAGGPPLEVTVTQEDGDGTVGFQFGATFIDSAKVFDQIRASVGGSDMYRCPTRWLLMRRRGEVATCEVTQRAARGKLLITLQDVDAGTVTWEIKSE